MSKYSDPYTIALLNVYHTDLELCELSWAIDLVQGINSFYKKDYRPIGYLDKQGESVLILCTENDKKIVLKIMLPWTPEILQAVPNTELKKIRRVKKPLVRRFTDCIKVVKNNSGVEAAPAQRFVQSAEIQKYVYKACKEYYRDHKVYWGFVPKVYDIGTSSRLYFSQEYVKAKSLTDWLFENSRLKRLQFFSIFLNFIEKIVHGINIAHCDIKPSNILVLEKEGVVFPVLLDFGDAKNMAEDSKLTRPGQGMSTPYYAPPELAPGGTAQLRDYRSDIFMFGILLHICYIGKEPTVIGKPRIDSLYNNHRERFSVGSIIETSLQNIYLRATEPNLKNRYQDVIFMRRAFENFLKIYEQRQCGKTWRNYITDKNMIPPLESLFELMNFLKQKED